MLDNEFYRCDNVADMHIDNSLCFPEELYHLDHENYEQHMTLNVFKGSVKEAIQVAADSGQLNDHLMAIAPLGQLHQYSYEYFEVPHVEQELINCALYCIWTFVKHVVQPKNNDVVNTSYGL